MVRCSTAATAAACRSASGWKHGRQHRDGKRGSLERALAKTQTEGSTGYGRDTVKRVHHQRFHVVSLPPNPTERSSSGLREIPRSCSVSKSRSSRRLHDACARAWICDDRYRVKKNGCHLPRMQGTERVPLPATTNKASKTTRTRLWELRRIIK